MARPYARPLARLIEELERLPGIGPKSAQRLAYYLIEAPADEVAELTDSILRAKADLKRCAVCFNLAEADKCPVCSDPARDHSTICVVAEPRDLIAMENSGEFRGVYHVLGGVISPLDDIGPDELHIRELLQRTKNGEVTEIIIATNPVVEGDATALYLAKVLKPLVPKVTRIALGLPVGGDLDYADQVTIARALSGRTLL